MAGRPAFELDQLEAVIPALRADAVDQGFERRKPALPIVLAHRHGFGDFIGVKRGQGDIDVALAARRVENSPRARPIFDRLEGAIRRGFRGIGYADLAASARAVLDNKALMQRALQHIGFVTGQCVG